MCSAASPTGTLAARLGAELFTRHRDAAASSSRRRRKPFRARACRAHPPVGRVILETAAEDGFDGAATVAHALVQRAVDGDYGIARLSVALDRPVIGLGASAPPTMPDCRRWSAILRRARRRRRGQCARRRRRPGARLRRSLVSQPSEGIFRLSVGDGAPRDFPPRRGAGEAEARVRAIVSSALAASTDAAEIAVTRDVKASTVEPAHIRRGEAHRHRLRPARISE